MAIRFQLRRGNTAENDAFTGALGELTLDTQRKVIRFHDGVTRGGIELGAPSLVAVQRPTAANGYTWYRKYSDGWVEQGGRCSIAQDKVTVVNLPVAMEDTQYTILITARKDGSTQTGGDGNFTADPINNSSFNWRNGDDFGGYGYWVVRGYAAA